MSLDHGLHGYLAAVLVMTLSLYPLVYLPVATSLRSLDGSLHEAARSLGVGPWGTFFRVTLRQIRPALLGGCLLVTLGLLAEYGAFEIVQYQTFTVRIFTEFKLGFDTVSACSLALVLVALSVAALVGELALNGRGRLWRSGPGARRVRPARRPRPLERAGDSGAGAAVRAGARRSARRAPVLDDPWQLDDAPLLLDPRRAGLARPSSARPLPPSRRCSRSPSRRSRSATATGSRC